MEVGLEKALIPAEPLGALCTVLPIQGWLLFTFIGHYTESKTPCWKVPAGTPVSVQEFAQFQQDLGVSALVLAVMELYWLHQKLSDVSGSRFLCMYYQGDNMGS